MLSMYERISTIRIEIIGIEFTFVSVHWSELDLNLGINVEIIANWL